MTQNSAWLTLIADSTNNPGVLDCRKPINLYNSTSSSGGLIRTPIPSAIASAIAPRITLILSRGDAFFVSALPTISGTTTTSVIVIDFPPSGGNPMTDADFAGIGPGFAAYLRVFR